MATVGHGLAVAVYRPLAEQLLTAAAPAEGERILELSCGDGELTRLLARGPTANPANAVAEPPADHLPFADGSFDLAVSLLAVAGADAALIAFAELARVARRAAVLVWTDGATHENTLRDAWAELGVPGTPPDVTLRADPPPGWSRAEVADVARFDGIGQLWAALVTERGVTVPAAMRLPLRERLAHHAAAFAAADGTLRIPVHATALSRGPS